MRIVTKRVDGQIATNLGVIFGIDTYGYPRKIDMIIPPSHSLEITSKPIQGWNFTGDKITLYAGSGDTYLYTMDIIAPDEGKNNNYWMNTEIGVKLNEFIYFIAYY